MAPASAPTSTSASVFDAFAAVDDPRVDRSKRHRLLDILTITLCGVLSGADGWVDIVTFAHAKEPWLRSFLPLPNGIPSHDTFGRVFAALDPVQFQQGFFAWVQATTSQLPDLTDLDGLQHVALDGKTLRRSHDRTNGHGPLHLVSAWASANRLVLGQVAVETKSNEIVALPALIQLLDLTHCLTTIDAIGCQTAIAAAIIEQGGEYALALKGNQGTLHREVAATFAHARATGFAGITHDTFVTLEKGHGRIEERRWWTISDPAYLAYLDPTGAWRKLRSIAMVERERTIGETVTRETQYYLASVASARTVGRGVRLHWGVENGLHWVLDIAFREDECRVRMGHAAQNLAMVRHPALNVLRQDTASKIGVKARRLKAAWDTSYLACLLGQLN